MLTLKKFKPSGTITIPGSKSHTIRALLIAAMAKGKSKIRNPLHSEDTASAISILSRCGVIFKKENNILSVDSTNFEVQDGDVLDCGNSGTTLYLCLGLLATSGKTFTLIGDSQLSARPIKPLVTAYKALGVEFLEEVEHLPLTVKGKLLGGNVSVECKTSQYLSSLLLSLPLAETISTVDCPLLYEKPYVSMTLAWLEKQGIVLEHSPDLQHYRINQNQSYHPFEDFIPGDYSSATFFFALAAITNSAITVSGLVKDDSQGDKAVLDVLEKMGCTITWEGSSVTVQGPEKLKGGTFDLNPIPDSLPALAVVAAYAHDDVILSNVANARIKETDRIAVMKENLIALGVECDDTPSSLIIKGKGFVKGGQVKGYKDHRIIMALAICSAMVQDSITIDDVKAVDITFPTFFTLLKELNNG